MQLIFKARAYEDFNRFVERQFGGMFVVYFGYRKNPVTQFEACATNGFCAIKYFATEMPESFPQEYTGKQAVHISDMDGFEFP